VLGHICVLAAAWICSSVVLFLLVGLVALLTSWFAHRSVQWHAAAGFYWSVWLLPMAASWLVPAIGIRLLDVLYRALFVWAAVLMGLISLPAVWITVRAVARLEAASRQVRYANA
jgi:hypothetical protein